MYGDGLGGISQEPGFMVVKKLEESEGAEEQASTTTDATDSKEWEVRPLYPPVDYSNELFCFVSFCLFVFDAVNLSSVLPVWMFFTCPAVNFSVVCVCVQFLFTVSV